MIHIRRFVENSVGKGSFFREVYILAKISAIDGGSKYSDKELLELYLGGNDSAFTVLVNRYIGLIRYITAKYRVSGLSADDLVQEGLLGFLLAARSFRSDGGTQFRNYAVLCINRRLTTLLRKSGTSRSKALNDYISIYDEAFDEVSGGIEPEDTYIGEESLSSLGTALSKLLSEKEQHVLRLYLAGESYAEIAQALGSDRKSVDNAMQRIRRKLKDYISSISL